MEDLKFDTEFTICKALDLTPTLTTFPNDEYINNFTSKYLKAKSGVKLFNKCYKRFGDLDFSLLKEDKFFKFE